MSTAQLLAAGLCALGPNFSAELCEACKGEGQYPQTYTLGCGMGSYRTMGRCDWCDGGGLRQFGRVAPKSVVNQVLQAATQQQQGDESHG